MAGTDHKTRLRIASIAAESTPGTFNDDVTGGCKDPTNAALQVYVAGTNFETNNDVFDREIAAKTYSKEPGLISRKTGTITVQAEARGAGGTITDVVSFDLWLKACGFLRGSAESFLIDGNGGHANLDQAYAGMTLSQTGSPSPSPTPTAKLIYLNPHTAVLGAGETTTVLIYASTGTPNGTSEWTGTGLDGSTVTIVPDTSTPAPYGNVYYPDTSMKSGSPLSDDRYSCALWHPYTTTNSTRHKLEGCVGNMALSAANIGEPLFLNFTIQGRIPSSNGQDDAITLTDIPYETTTPPTFSGLTALVHNRTYTGSPANEGDWESDVCFNTFDIDLNNDLQLDECATATGGVRKIDINGRAPTGNINPRLLEESVLAYFDEWDLEDDMIMRLQHGSAVGNRFEMIASRVRFTSFGLGDVNGNTVVNFPFGIYTPKADPGDNEIYFITR